MGRDPVSVNLSYKTPVTDAELALLGGVTKLGDPRSREGYPPVGDASLVHLRGLTRLLLANPQTTPKSPTPDWHAFQGLTQLKQLELSNTQVTDAGTGASPRTVASSRRCISSAPRLPTRDWYSSVD